MIQVERIGNRLGQPYEQTNYYISSLVTWVAEFAQRVRKHWGIDNRLHSVKNTIFSEDSVLLKDYNSFFTNQKHYALLTLHE